MSDRYSPLVNTGVGRALAKQLGLPRPVALRRGRGLPEHPVAVGAVGQGTALAAVRESLDSLGAHTIDAVTDSPTADPMDQGPERPPAPGQSPDADGDGHAEEVIYVDRLGAIIVDATAAHTLTDLEQVRGLLRPALRKLAPSARVLVLGTPPDQAGDVEESATAQALEGIVRSVGKELRAGATANLLRVERDAQTRPDVLSGPLKFFLEGRSAYVSGQPLRIRAADVPAADSSGPDRPSKPFTGKVVVVTGAARGIGAGIAKVFARDGAHVVAVDVPAAGQALSAVANEVGGTALQLDITAPDAGERIASLVADRFAGPIHAVVHNAGITRDKLLVNTDAERWGNVLGVNLAAQLAINEVLLEPGRTGGLADGGRIVSVSSTSGIAGNRGQANYAASKAGVIGLVRHLSRELADRSITVNAVAPGFIESEMTGRMPMATREVSRRLNSLSQGGRPVDVAETIAFLADPASAGVTGQVLRVCGQMQIGA